MPVFSINDRRMGSVSQVNPCCFKVESPEGQLHLQSASVFNIDDFKVTLMCQPADVERYKCGFHSSVAGPAHR